MAGETGRCKATWMRSVVEMLRKLREAPRHRVLVIPACGTAQCLQSCRSAKRAQWPAAVQV